MEINEIMNVISTLTETLKVVVDLETRGLATNSAIKDITIDKLEQHIRKL